MEYLSTIPYYKTKRYSIDRTSIKLRYNHFLNNSPKYDDIKEVKKLYKDCIKYNESFKTNPNNDIDYLDLSVFEEYGFKNIPVYGSRNTDKRKNDFDSGDWGVPIEMDIEDNDFSVEEILNMPIESDLVSESEKSIMPENKLVDVDTFSMNPVKTITIKKKEQNKEIPLEIKIQQYADELYEQHGYGTEYEMSIFIAELAEKFPGLDDYEKYYNSAKKLHELSV